MCPPMSTLIHYRLFTIIHVYNILAHTWAIPVYSHTGIPTLGFIQCTHTREPYRATCFPLSTLIQCLIFITIHVYNILAHSGAIPVYPHMGISTLWFYPMYPRTDTLPYRATCFPVSKLLPALNQTYAKCPLKNCTWVN